MSSIISAEDEPQRVPLLELAQKCLAQSRMIFLVADLRLLRLTGRINTRYDALCLDSDCFLRTTCEGMMRSVGVEQKDDGKGQHGIMPSHVMAILLLEMNYSLTDQRGGDVLDYNDDDASDDGGGLMNNLRISRSDPILASKAEGDLNALLRAYVATMRADLADDIPKVPLGVVVSSQLSKDMMSSSDGGMSPLPSDPPMNLCVENPARKHDSEKESFNKAFTSLGSYIFSTVTSSDGDNVCDKDDLVKILKRAIRKRDIEILSFLETFFKERSITKMMAESKTELMWLHDWHSQKECTYAISMDREEKTNLVVFRGATTAADWDHSLHWSTLLVDNPIAEDYQNKEKSIELHSWYYRYLFRKRKDT
jgi:hypothetical protein